MTLVRHCVLPQLQMSKLLPQAHAVQHSDPSDPLTDACWACQLCPMQQDAHHRWPACPGQHQPHPHSPGSCVSTSVMDTSGLTTQACGGRTPAGLRAEASSTGQQPLPQASGGCTPAGPTGSASCIIEQGSEASDLTRTCRAWELLTACTRARASSQGSLRVLSSAGKDFCSALSCSRPHFLRNWRRQASPALASGLAPASTAKLLEVSSLS